MPEEICTIDMLIQKILTEDKQYDLSKIISSYEFAAKAHEGQTRSSGQPYIIHPLSVSYILLELGMDTDTICAAMLHDVVEDTPVTLEEVKKRFGQDVAMLVDGVTKLNKIPIFSRRRRMCGKCSSPCPRISGSSSSSCATGSTICALSGTVPPISSGKPLWKP